MGLEIPFLLRIPSRLQSYLPLAAGVYTLTAMIVFYNYVIDTNIVFHTLGINSRHNVLVQYKTSPESKSSNAGNT
jgi:hypothetical protein